MTAGLNAEELLHLGLHASQHDDPAKAIDYLKQCIALEPTNAGATYLLGALYAQIGSYDRAREALTRAVDLNGSPTAVFQLGLLHLTSGDVSRAALVWERLDELPADHAFNLFRRALLALARYDFAGCIELLAANAFSEALNPDMRKIKCSAEAARDRNASGAVASSTLRSGKGQLLLGSYRQKSRH